MNDQNVRVGVGVFIFRDGKFLMQKRTGAHGEGTWSVPGGHLEFGETAEQTAHRETSEETGCVIKNIRFAAVTNDIFEDDDKHYVTWWVMSDWSKNEPKIVETDKCTEQKWVDFDTIPSPLFLCWENLLDSEFVEGIKSELIRKGDKS